MIAIDQPPTESEEPEQGLISAIFFDPTCIDVVSSIVQASDFLINDMRIFYQAMIVLHAAKQPVNDIAVVIDFLKRAGRFSQLGGAAGVFKVLRSAPHFAHAKYYAEIIAKRAQRRGQIKIAEEMLRDATEGTLEPDEISATTIARLDGLRSVKVAEVRRAGDVASELVDDLERQLNQPIKRGVMTGIYTLDATVGGMMPGELVVLAARTSVGKTVMGMQIAEHSALHERPALVASLEMKDREVVGRTIAKHSGINGMDLRSGNLTVEDIKTLRTTGKMLGEMPLFIWAPSSPTVAQIRAMAKLHHAREGLQLLVIDYLSFIKPASYRGNKVDWIGDITIGLKEIAKELSIPILLLAQLNRASEKETRMPRLDDLRDSGSIEQDADVVIFLHKADRKDVDTTLIVAKHRHGTIFKMPLEWDARSTTFIDPKQPVANNALANFNRG